MAEAEAIFNRLKQDHDQHRDLLTKIEDTSGDTEERRTLFEKFTKDVKSHAAAEEQAVYSTMLRKPDTTDATRHSVAEHQELDEALNDLAATDMSSSAWLQKFKQVKHDYLHHIEEEEDDHFPEFEEKLTAEDERQMAEIFEKRKNAELENAEVTPEAASDAKE
ncbi:hemerythrin domain-containing protein [Altererythrobacter sp. RZ02]|uniref:Hemerythrin domain-containing protein n=1 Tax=Pontixanthobacter rizhaonensis TaxID=2730337 RepID=A0A848QJB8_9SPHN|nr:hemerythrin domain-containing protein [Pontixanthobacter rizhaonensis]NMW31164.1 hemerythrin domain-containing protein [Pontixanthobacter rizhaonensis]